jgi:hypothetical protein
VRVSNILSIHRAENLTFGLFAIVVTHLYQETTPLCYVNVSLKIPTNYTLNLSFKFIRTASFKRLWQGVSLIIFEIELE